MRYSEILIRIKSLYHFKQFLFILAGFSNKLARLLWKSPQKLQSHKVLSTSSPRSKEKLITDINSECCKGALTCCVFRSCTHFWNFDKCYPQTYLSLALWNICPLQNGQGHVLMMPSGEGESSRREKKKVSKVKVNVRVYFILVFLC